MAVRFNRLVQPRQAVIRDRFLAESVAFAMSASDSMVFMSHKTGDSQAENEAAYIAHTHGVKVYMAEWDDNIHVDSDEIPDHIMDAIRICDGFLVNVTAAIAVSMWIGYEIGGAHAMRKSRAKIMYTPVSGLPSVVRSLRSLHNRVALDRWIRANVL